MVTNIELSNARTSYRRKYGFDLIIFSMDRAMQLEALFSSIKQNAPKVFNKITVVWKGNNSDFIYSYQLLEEDYPDINFIHETDFCNDIKNIINDSVSPKIMFLTDDDIIFKPIKRDVIKLIGKETVCFSFRLGRNINYCYSNDKPNKIGVHSEQGSYIMWDWDDQELDFAYPLSVTAHIFQRRLIKELLEDLYFETPNVMEGKLQQKLDVIPRQMIAYKESKIVGIPANRVNKDNQNRHGLKYPYTATELNNLFLANKRIDINKMDFSNITAAQQEIKYEFTS